MNSKLLTTIAALLIFLMVGYFNYNKKEPQAAVETVPQKTNVSEVLAPVETPLKTVGLFSLEEQHIIDTILVDFNNKNYQASLTTAETAFQSATRGGNFYNWFLSHLPIILTSLAWKKINTNNCSAAIPLLKRAEIFSKHVATLKGLAICYFKLKTLSSSEEYFEKYLEREQTDNQMLILYSETLESSFKYKKSIEALEQAIKNSPEDDTLKTRLASMKEKAKQGSQQVSLSTSHFNLSYHPSDDYDIVDFILETLETSLEEFINKYSFREPKVPIEVILYPKDRFRKVMGHGPKWASGVFDGRIRVSIPTDQARISKFSQIETVLRHELVHALFSLMTNFRSIPTWVNEGIAQRLECSGGCEHNFFSITQNSFLEPKQLNGSFLKLDRVNAQLSYHQSLYLILAIENDKNLQGTNPIERIIAKIPSTGPLSSNRLLKPLRMTFKNLHQQATKLWNDRVALKPIP